MTTILSLETATNACSAALQVEGDYFARFDIAPRQHAKLLLPMIQALFNEAGIVPADLDAVAFGCGPGSFMGVRLAVGMAQGLAFGANCPVISISTLQTLAQSTYDQTQASHILSAWDARMGDLYWGEYAVDSKGLMQPQRKDQLSKPSEIDIDRTISYSAAGNAWSVYASQLPDLFSDVVAEQYADLYPDARAMLSLAESKLLAGKVCSPIEAHPHYCRDQVVNTSPKKNSV